MTSWTWRHLPLFVRKWINQENVNWSNITKTLSSPFAFRDKLDTTHLHRESPSIHFNFIGFLRKIIQRIPANSIYNQTSVITKLFSNHLFFVHLCNTPYVIYLKLYRLGNFRWEFFFKRKNTFFFILQFISTNTKHKYM